MKRKAYVLTEILTSMMLQLMFTFTLCAAFYMLLSFSTSTQQVIAAHDDGEVVISYIDSRIRNAGLGLWRCGSTEGVNKAFGANINGRTNFEVIDKEYGSAELKNGMKATDILPVSIVSSIDKAVKISCDKTKKIYEGNVLNILYAHEDTEDAQNDSKDIGMLVLQGLYDESPDKVAEIGPTITMFEFIDNSDDFNKNIKTNFTHANPGKNTITNNSTTDIKSWAAMEAGGVPIHIEQINYKSGTSEASWKVRLSAPYVNAKVYPVSELLNIECERIYVGRSGDNNGLMIKTLGYDDKTKKAKWDTHPHAKNILELHMILDATKDIPIFTLEVLASEGTNSSGDTQRPDTWPAAYWRDDFASYNVSISRAEWKLYNLAPLF